MKSTPGDRDRHSSGRGTTPEPFITIVEVAARLRKHVRSVNLLMQRRLIPYYKIGRHVRFKWSEVEAQLRKQCRNPARAAI